MCKLTLVDGQYHEVDSSEMAFKIAGSMVMKEAARKADPALLEPMMAVEVTTPEDNMGDVIGDLNSRRGIIQSMEERSGARVVKALVPLSEMFGYVGDLRSKTQGRASYSMQFDSYAEVPQSVAKEIIAKATAVASACGEAACGPSWTARARAVDRVLRAVSGAPSQNETIQSTGGHQWRRRSSSGLSRTSTSAPLVTSTTVRRR